MTLLSLWENADPPSAGIASFTDSPINLGTIFVCSGDVAVEAIRYYRMAGSPYAAEQNRPEAVGVYRVTDENLMVSSSTVPAIVNGWNEVAVASTALVAGVYYMAVAFYGGRGSNPNYTAEGGYFQSFSITNGVLSSPATNDPTAPDNGQYVNDTVLRMPFHTFNGGGYFIDVVVSTGGASTTLTLSGGGSQAAASHKEATSPVVTTGGGAASSIGLKQALLQAVVSGGGAVGATPGSPTKQGAAGLHGGGTLGAASTKRSFISTLLSGGGTLHATGRNAANISRVPGHIELGVPGHLNLAIAGHIE